MIKVTVRKAAMKRGIKTPYQLAQRVEKVADKEPSIKTQQMARRLWEGVKLPRLESVDSVAGALGDCDLSELLRRIPDRRTRRPKSPERSRKNSTNGLKSLLTNQAD